MFELLLCVSQAEAGPGFRFKMTGLSVYSFEEALYHCYHYWQQSIDEIASEEFSAWVGEGLGLTYLAAKIKRLAKADGLTERVTSFLTLTDYFSGPDISALRAEIEAWESRLEWERLKDRGDYLMGQDDPGWAALYYKKALAFSENAPLLNNLAVASLRMSRYADAQAYLEQAVALAPENLRLYLNLAEAAIFARDFDKALWALGRVEEADPGNPDIQYLYGELNFATGNTRYSIEYFERAIRHTPDPHYIYRLTDVYVKLRQYSRALETLDRAAQKGRDWQLKQAEVHVMSNHVPAAIRCVERALVNHHEDLTLWVRLAAYHRLDYDLDRAHSAIVKALSLGPENDAARLESARIKKAMGRTKEYRQVLRQILTGMKKKYRETTV
jgi:tetratricopeptide (TPR) repeat protein